MSSKRLFKTCSIAVILALGTSGCMGTAPRRIETFQYGDESKSCQMLQSEVSECESKIKALEGKRKSKVGGNIALGIVGGILFWPALFFIDAKSDENAEIEGFQQRRKSLASIAQDKGCEWCIGKSFDVPETELKSVESVKDESGEEGNG